MKRALSSRLLGESGVRGVGLVADASAAGGFAVVIRLADPADADALGLPEVIDGVPVRVGAVGDVTALGLGSGDAANEPP